MAHVFTIPAWAAEVDAAKDRALGLPMPPYPINHTVGIVNGNGMAINYTDAEEIDTTRRDAILMSIWGTPMCFPVKLKTKTQTDGEWWLLPMEPIITITGKNIIKRRTVSKISPNLNRRAGSIKEYWAEDDYEVTIEGMLTSAPNERTYPKDDLKKLLELKASREVINVQSPLFEYVGISAIAIEDFDILFTKGEENQAYKIKGYSDDPWELFINL